MCAPVGPLHRLRPQRALLHRPLPPLLQLPDHHSRAPPRERQRQHHGAHVSLSRIASGPEAEPALPESVLGSSDGDGKSEQNG